MIIDPASGEMPWRPFVRKGMILGVGRETQRNDPSERRSNG
jgi:hypothetical protein